MELKQKCPQVGKASEALDSFSWTQEDCWTYFSYEMGKCKKWPQTHMLASTKCSHFLDRLHIPWLPKIVGNKMQDNKCSTDQKFRNILKRGHTHSSSDFPQQVQNAAPTS
jgi:hypothetical protein